MASSNYPCPICKQVMTIIGRTSNGKKLTSCNHTFVFKQSRSQKDFNKKYIKTPDGGFEIKIN